MRKKKCDNDHLAINLTHHLNLNFQNEKSKCMYFEDAKECGKKYSVCLLDVHEI